MSEENPINLSTTPVSLQSNGYVNEHTAQCVNLSFVMIVRTNVSYEHDTRRTFVSVVSLLERLVREARQAYLKSKSYTFL